MAMFCDLVIENILLAIKDNLHFAPRASDIK